LKHAYLKVFVLCYHLEVDFNQFLSYLMYENLTAYSVSTFIISNLALPFLATFWSN